jgi:hypothetical protein
MWEIAYLAREFGWSEGDILNLPREKRVQYCEILNEIRAEESKG